VAFKSLRENVAGLGPWTFSRVYQQKHSVDKSERPFNLASKVCMSRSVDEVDLRAVPIDRGGLCENRDTSLTLLIVGIHDAVDELLMFSKHASGAQQAIDEGRLAVVDVRDKRNIAQRGEGHGRKDTEHRTQNTEILAEMNRLRGALRST